MNHSKSSLSGNKKTALVIAVCALIAAGSVFIGPVSIGLSHALTDPLASKIILSVRLPRTLVAIIVGSALGASGAVLQGILRNPLADPYILGISSGAAFFAAFGLVLGAYVFGSLTTPALAFIGAAATGIIVGSMGLKRGRMYPERLLLAGIGLGFLFTALLLLILTLSTNEGLRRAMLWVFGDLSMAELTLIPFGALVVAIGLALSIWRSRALNALMLGDDAAHSLGFSPNKERGILFASASLMTAAAVSLGGVIGFLGLLMPHLVRFTVGSDSRLVVPLSAACGAALLSAADAVGRTIIAPTELPSGIITAIIGAPYFLYLLKRKEIIGGG